MNTEVEKVTIGHKVHDLDDYLFQGYHNLLTVDFTNARSTVSVTIGCFDGCSNFMNFVNYNLPLSIIEDRTFNECNRLLILPSHNIVHVGDNAFTNDYELKVVNLSSYVDYIGLSAFLSCLNLAISSNAICSPKIRDNAFQGTLFNSVNIIQPSDFRFIGKNAFSDNLNLLSANIEGQSHLGTSMFENCSQLSVVNFTDLTGQSYFHESVFRNCSSLIEITIPYPVVNLSERLFENCVSLSSVKFESGSLLKCLCDKAFYNCQSLYDLEIPNSITSIWQLMDNCFEDSNLTCVTLKGFEDFTEADKSRLYETAMFGLKHDCLIVFGNGDDFEYVYDDTKPTAATIPEVDSKKLSNFKTGKWYSNVELLEQYAKAKGRPAVIIGGLNENAGFEFFKKYIWQNSDFLSWVSALKMYFGIVSSDCQWEYNNQASYFLTESAKDAKNFETSETNAMGETFYDTTLSTAANAPLLKVYHAITNTNYDYTLSYVDSLIRNTEIGLSETVEFIKRICLNHFDSNNTSAEKYVTGVTSAFNRYDFNPYYVEFLYSHEGINFTEFQHCKSSKTYTLQLPPYLEDGKMTNGWLINGLEYSNSFLFTDVARDTILTAIPNTYTYEFDLTDSTIFVLEVGSDPIYIDGDIIEDNQVVIDYDYVDESLIIIRSNRSPVVINAVSAINDALIVVDWDYNDEEV